jgi:hypothetical protein
MVQSINQYHYLRAKGSAPPMGSIGKMFDAMPPTLRKRLLERIEPQDRALSDTIARLLERTLLDPRR